MQKSADARVLKAQLDLIASCAFGALHGAGVGVCAACLASADSASFGHLPFVFAWQLLL